MFDQNKYQEIVDSLKHNKFSNITFIIGPGVSLPAGVPDFRALDETFAPVLLKYGIEDPLELFELSSFIEDPQPFYEFCKLFDIDMAKPTKAHLFMGFLYQKNIINKIFTQNIDALELKAGIPEDIIVFAHGRVNEACCPKCQTPVDLFVLKNEYIMKDKIKYCEKCNTPVKPKVTFYGESLPQTFYNSFLSIQETDLCFILGNDLGIAPFNSLPDKIPEDAWKVVINNENVEGFSFDDLDEKDFFLKGEPDKIIEKLVKDVGWEDEFQKYCQQIMAVYG